MMVSCSLASMLPAQILYPPPNTWYVPGFAGSYKFRFEFQLTCMIKSIHNNNNNNKKLNE